MSKAQVHERGQTSTVNMRHVDGITVCLERLDGPKYAEYQNPYETRHTKYKGGLGSRLVVAEAGEKFDRGFKLYSADGIAIIVVVGDETEQLRLIDNTQAFWLDPGPKRIDFKDLEHRFDAFTTWETEARVEPTRQLSMRMPRPDRMSTLRLLLSEEIN